ncbi:hypothetical protein ROA7023_04485 [Roseisalinus antarcticus]|uniref:DNA methylase n=1 Tax=Roseisalinus antarcticus TaxID=254357 RepID=A0A1Y5TZW8_9RHOB|nr:hypothetical protein ROA7023_04485 [Roseisalinus antarcticus]
MVTILSSCPRNRQQLSTLIAAETTGRVCYGVELNPAYVDVAIERWQAFTGETAVLIETDESFAALKAKRLAA